MTEMIKGLRVISDPGAAVTGNLIGGRWEVSGASRFLEVISPATGKIIGHVQLSDRETARRAVAAAGAARDRLRRMSVWERSKLCLAVADVIERRQEELARLLTLEQGKPFHTEAMVEAVGAATAFRDAAEQIKWLETSAFPVQDRNKRAFSILQPKGVFAVITPWNFPLSQPCCYYLAPALATGNAVVWVPAPTTSLIAAKIAECMVEAGVPEGAVNLVTGDGAVVGDEIVANPGTDAIAFTGSSETGATIARRGAGKPLLLECGGNGPTIVLDDADIGLAAERIARGCFTNAGQICTSTERILVAVPVYDAFVEAMVAAAAKVRLGDPFDAATTMGPLNNEPTAAKVDAHLQDALGKGGKVLAGGGRQENRPTRLYYMPTVIADVAPDSLLNVDETFGPVAPVLRFRDKEDAFRLIAMSRFGLNAAVFTRDMTKAYRWAEDLRVGMVNINEHSAYWETHIPAGGSAGSGSGIGRTGGRHSLLDMSDLKTVTISLTD